MTDIAPETMDAWLRVTRVQMPCPFFFHRNIIRQAKAAGLDTDKLKADGIIAETQRIPTK